MADNTVTIVGNLTRDPELRFTAGGKGVASFGRRRQPPLPGQRRMAREGVVLQRHRVGHARRERRGVAHQGHPHHRHRSPRAARVRDPSAGEKRNVVEIVADELGPSLRWARAEVERTQRTGPDGTPCRQQPPGGSPSPVAAPAIPCTATKSRSDPRRSIPRKTLK